MVNLSGDWLQIFIDAVQAAVTGKRENDMLRAWFWKWRSTERQLIVVLWVM